MIAPGAAVKVTPPMTPMASHDGVVIGKARGRLGACGYWRVRFNAWGMMITESLPASAISPA